MAKTRDPAFYNGVKGMCQRADGMWRVTVELANDGAGRRRWTQSRANPEEAFQLLLEMQRKVAREGDVLTAAPTIKQWSEVWLKDYVKPHVRPRTYDSYLSLTTQHIVPTLGRIRVDKLKPEHVRRLHAKVRETCSPTTVHTTHRVFAVMMAAGVEEGVVKDNVVRKVKAPKKGTTKRPALTSEDAAKLIRHAAEAGSMQEALRWLLALATGIRQGERLGLSRAVAQLAVDNGYLYIRQQLQRLAWEHGCGAETDDGWPCGRSRGGNCTHRMTTFPDDLEAEHVVDGYWLTPVKSDAGDRAIPVVPLLRMALKAYLAQTDPDPTGLLFADGGRPIDPADDTKAWHAACKAAGVKDVPQHSARHTTGSLLLQWGVPIEVIRDILGHVDVDTSLIYAHRSDPMLEAAMNTLTESLDLDPKQLGWMSGVIEAKGA